MSPVLATKVAEPTARGPLGYRPDIDGLRGLAVIAVVWFHSDLPGLPGGFTGVDVFFVISGYLITLIIHREVAAGQFSFRHFYERRVRRIAPALLLVTGVSAVVALTLLLPFELDQFCQSAIATVAMVPNIYFWRNGGDYFQLTASIVPLLHTWSLGVEEQFYLLFPATLMVAERLRLTRTIIAVLALGSFAVGAVASYRYPVAAFYLLPARGWELMIGAALAVNLASIPERVRPAAGLVGLALIALGFVTISEADLFPGWVALLPTVGAALLVGSGPHGPASRMLSSRPIVYVGKISYSFYLWLEGRSQSSASLSRSSRRWRRSLLLPDRTQLEPIDFRSVVALERPFLLAVVDGAPDDDLVYGVLLDIDHVDRSILGRLMRAGVSRLRLKRLVADGRAARVLRHHADGRGGHHRHAAAQPRGARESHQQSPTPHHSAPFGRGLKGLCAGFGNPPTDLTAAYVSDLSRSRTPAYECSGRSELCLRR